MRDTKEYLETVGRLDGVILLNWTEKTLQTQVDAITKPVYFKTSNLLERAVQYTYRLYQAKRGSTLLLNER